MALSIHPLGNSVRGTESSLVIHPNSGKWQLRMTAPSFGGSLLQNGASWYHFGWKSADLHQWWLCPQQPDTRLEKNQAIISDGLPVTIRIVIVPMTATNKQLLSFSDWEVAILKVLPLLLITAHGHKSRGNFWLRFSRYSVLRHQVSCVKLLDNIPLCLT